MFSKYGYNPAFCRILEKCGFELEGTLRKNAVKNGVVVDMKMYSILKE
ncbi:GNAT family N-acetyltransferase [Bacteroides congonensis]|nr:GNAT family protein [Bacteroides congonensis]